MEFNAGDVVRLKSGGPLMTVVDFQHNPNRVLCNWFTDDKREVHSGGFAPEAIEEIKPPPPRPTPPPAKGR